MSGQVAYNRKKSPTAAAVQFFGDLKAAGVDVSNLGQGRETEDAPESIFPKTMKITTSSAYNSKIGGEDEARAVAAGYAERFLGIPATASNTFIIQKNGREGLEQMLLFAAKNNGSNKVLLPKYRWPMYDDILAKVRVKPKLYENPGNTPDDSDLGHRILEGGNAAVVINSPHNPTGKIYSNDFIKRLNASLEHWNSDRKRKKLFNILDVPYFYALPDASGKKHYLDGGFEQVCRVDSKTPWMTVISFSKALGTATPGLSFVVVHPDIAEAVSRHLTSGGGVSYDPAFYKQITTMFAPDHDHVHRAHFTKLRAKYQTNFNEIVRLFGREAMVDGDPGMTALLKFEDALGKTIEGRKGTYHLNTTADLVHYLGNEHGVVTVDNGNEGSRALIRVALAPAPDVFKPAIARLKEAYDIVTGPSAPQARTGMQHGTKLQPK